MIKTLLIASGLALVALAGIAGWPVLASSEGVRASSEAIPDGEWLSVAEITRRIEAKGYTVHEVDRERNAYEVEAVDANGLRLEARVDPRTGEIVSGDDD